MCCAKSKTGRVLININGIIFTNVHDTLESMHCQLIHTPCYKSNFHSQTERNRIIDKRYNDYSEVYSSIGIAIIILYYLRGFNELIRLP